jgi:hypothetical protein
MRALLYFCAHVFASFDPPLDVARHALQMAEQCTLLLEDHRDRLVGKAPLRPRRRWREWSDIANAELAPSPLHAVTGFVF